MDQRNWMQKWTDSPQDVRGFVWKESSCQPHVYIHQISLIYHHYTTFISLWYHHFFQEKKRPGRLEVWIPLRPLRRAQGWTSVARRSPRGGGVRWFWSRKRQGRACIRWTCQNSEFKLYLHLLRWKYWQRIMNRLISQSFVNRWFLNREWRKLISH